MKFKEIINESMPLLIFNKLKDDIKKIYGKQVGSTIDFKTINIPELRTIHIIENEGMSNNKDKNIIETNIKNKYPKITKITWEKK